MFCKNCGSQIADNMKFCPVCGKACDEGNAANGAESFGGAMNETARQAAASIPIVTTDELPGRQLIALGMVKGTAVQARHIGKDFLSGIKNLTGGELKAYSEMIDATVGLAVGRMMQKAVEMGADAVVGMRLASSSVMDGAAEIIAYGTAVKTE